MLDAADPGERGLFERLARNYASRASVSMYELDASRMTDPIAKGKVLAELEARDLVVAVGDGATEFTARELEDVPVYFVDATMVDGRRLQSASVTGLFSYSVDALLDAAKALRLSNIGLVFTPGYEPVASWIRGGAVLRGMNVVEKRIDAPRELPPAVRGLLDKARAVWVVGDPLLARGAGYDLIREQTLSAGVPMIMNGEWGVRRGALLGHRSDPDDQAAAAGHRIDEALRGAEPPQRLHPAPRGGETLYNSVLFRKWRLEPPAGARWTPLP